MQRDTKEIKDLKEKVYNNAVKDIDNAKENNGAKINLTSEKLQKFIDISYELHKINYCGENYEPNMRKIVKTAIRNSTCLDYDALEDGLLANADLFKRQPDCDLKEYIIKRKITK